MNIVRNDLRNIAIIAHVDHGKTTLVDEMLKQGGVFRQNQQVQDRVMDSNDLERERGITILSKNTAVHYNGVKINIVDTPGHADFSGEVERVLKMVSGVLLLVDSFEGPMPQTRFVLKKALELNLKVIIVVNKTDRPDARCDEVVDETLELLIDLDASDEQLDSPIIYASGRTGTATTDWTQPGTDLRPLFDCILEHIPAPEGDPEGPLQLLVSTIDYNDYVGRIGVGRIERGSIDAGQMAIRCVYDSAFVSPPARLAGLFTFDGLKRVNAEHVEVGDIVAVSGFPDLLIGDTICPPAMAEPLPFVKIDEPTISMTFCVNDSPFAGTEGTYVTSRHLRARLEKEALTDVSLRVEVYDYRRYPVTSFLVDSFYSGREGETVTKRFSLDVSRLAPGRYYTRYVFTVPGANQAEEPVEIAAGLMLRRSVNYHTRHGWKKSWGSAMLGEATLVE